MGLVVSAGNEVLKGYEDAPAHPRYDVVYILDDRGWFHRVQPPPDDSHARRAGQARQDGPTCRDASEKREAAAGWCHLHFNMTRKQPSGLWGVENAYAYAWEAYQNQYRPDLIAAARPHHLIPAGETAILDATRSWSRAGGDLRYEWLFSDGAVARKPKIGRAYPTPGEYSEILKITDAAGNVDYDFAIVQVADKENPEKSHPTLHACYYPTFGIRAGDPVTFKVRSFRTKAPEETI